MLDDERWDSQLRFLMDKGANSSDFILLIIDEQQHVDQFIGCFGVSCSVDTPIYIYMSIYIYTYQ